MGCCQRPPWLRAVVLLALASRSLVAEELEVVAGSDAAGASRELSVAGTACTTPLDLVFVLDCSGSVGSAQFGQMLEFVAGTLAAFAATTAETRVAILTYSTSAKITLQCGLDATSCRAALAAAGRITCSGGARSSAGAALSKVLSLGDITTNVRPRAAGVPRVVVLVTDGPSHDATAAPVALLEAQGWAVHAVGVGASVDAAELNTIASAPASLRTLSLASFDALAAPAAAASVAAALCTGAATLAFGDGVAAVAAAESPRCFRVAAQAHHAVDATLTVAAGAGATTLQCAPGNAHALPSAGAATAPAAAAAAITAASATATATATASDAAGATARLAVRVGLATHAACCVVGARPVGAAFAFAFSDGGDTTCAWDTAACGLVRGRLGDHIEGGRRPWVCGLDVLQCCTSDGTARVQCCEETLGWAVGSPCADAVAAVPGATRVAQPDGTAAAAAAAAALPCSCAAFAPAPCDTAKYAIDPLIRACVRAVPASAAAAPSAPTAVTVAVSSSTSLFVRWAAASANGAAVTGYEVEVDVNSDMDAGRGTTLRSLPVAAGTTSVTVPGLTTGTGYFVRVRATNAEGAGRYGYATPAPIAPAGRPLTPARIEAVAVSAASVRVRVAGCGCANGGQGGDCCNGAPATSLTLEWSLSASFAGPLSRVLAHPPAGAVVDASAAGGYDVSVAATPGQLLFFRVAFTNARGRGPYNATTAAVSTRADGSSPAWAAPDCRRILSWFPGRASGRYWVLPAALRAAGRAAFVVYCDMTTLGGGWSLLTKLRDVGAGLDNHRSHKFGGSTWFRNGSAANDDGLLARVVPAAAPEAAALRAVHATATRALVPFPLAASADAGGGGGGDALWGSLDPTAFEWRALLVFHHREMAFKAKGAADYLDSGSQEAFGAGDFISFDFGSSGGGAAFAPFPGAVGAGVRRAAVPGECVGRGVAPQSGGAAAEGACAVSEYLELAGDNTHASGFLRGDCLASADAQSMHQGICAFVELADQKTRGFNFVTLELPDGTVHETCEDPNFVSGGGACTDHFGRRFELYYRYPHLALAPNGTAVLHFQTGRVLSPPDATMAPPCSGAAPNVSGLPAAFPLRACGADELPWQDDCLCSTEGGSRGSCTDATGVHVATTQQWPGGPFRISPVAVTGAGWTPFNASVPTLGESNPSAALLRDGRSLLAFRSHLKGGYWPGVRGEHIGFALSTAAVAPPFFAATNVTVSANLSYTTAAGNDEASSKMFSLHSSLHSSSKPTAKTSKPTAKKPPSKFAWHVAGALADEYIEHTASGNKSGLANLKRKLLQQGVDDVDEGASPRKKVKTPNKQAQKSKTAKKKKDPHAPKGAKSSYMFFCDYARKQERVSKLSFKEQGKEIGLMWKALTTDDEKKPYVDQAIADKARYKQAMAAYNAKQGL
eukprot:g4291.t1